MSIRLERIANLIKEEMSWIFLNKVQDPEIGFVTVTNVKVSPDLSYAKIYISVLEKENREPVLAKVEELNKMIRSELASRLNRMRQIPELRFFIDDTMDYVEKMDKLFKKIHKDDNKEE